MAFRLLGGFSRLHQNVGVEWKPSDGKPVRLRSRLPCITPPTVAIPLTRTFVNKLVGTRCHDPSKDLQLPSGARKSYPKYRYCAIAARSMQDAQRPDYTIRASCEYYRSPPAKARLKITSIKNGATLSYVVSCCTPSFLISENSPAPHYLSPILRQDRQDAQVAEHVERLKPVRLPLRV